MAVLLAISVVVFSCKKDDDDSPSTKTPDPGESTSELVVKKFSAAPTLDGEVDAIWATAKRLVGTCEVPSLGNRMTYYNPDGQGVEENLGMFYPYSGETYDFTLRSGYVGDDIYFLLEWDDADDSKDRESWYFDSSLKKWKQEHKYANADNDKFYEDKFAFFFPIGTVDGFSSTTCYAACHTASSIEKDKDKLTRHYLKTAGQKIDMWHWKRVRGTYNDRVDDQRTIALDPPYTSSSNGRKGDENGDAGYAGNAQTLNNGTEDVSVPEYIIPDMTDYYWISIDDVNDGTAKKVTAVDANGILTYEGGGTIDPSAGGYEQGSGNKRFPSVITSAFTGARGDITVKATHTGTGWVCEFTRKLDTGDSDDVIFDPSAELDFGMAIFNNAAIAHGIKPGLKMSFE